jgi:hypothetical protein
LSAPAEECARRSHVRCREVELHGDFLAGQTHSTGSIAGLFRFQAELREVPDRGHRDEGHCFDDRPYQTPEIFARRSDRAANLEYAGPRRAADTGAYGEFRELFGKRVHDWERCRSELLGGDMIPDESNHRSERLSVVGVDDPAGPQDGEWHAGLCQMVFVTGPRRIRRNEILSVVRHS